MYMYVNMAGGTGWGGGVNDYSSALKNDTN